MFERATNKEDLLVIDGASHYDLYDKNEYVDLAVHHLAKFYGQNLEE